MKRALLLPLFAAAAAAQMLPPAGSVALPIDEYNRLVEAAAKPPKKPEAPPVPWAMKSVAIQLRVNGESAAGTVQIEGEVLQKGLVKVPLLGGVTVLDARQSGGELPLEIDNGVPTAVLAGPSEFSITLDAGLPLTIESGRASFRLPAPPAGTVRLSLAIPGDHTNVTIASGLVTSRAANEGRTVIEAVLTPGQPATIWWTTRETAAPAAALKEARFLSDVKTLASVSDAVLAVTALVEITVVQGEPSGFEVEVPPGYEITTVTGSSLESTETRNGALLLDVGPAAALRNHQFLIAMERAVEGTKAEIPLASVKGSQRETGEALVEGAGSMELTAAERGGLKRMDLKETSPYLLSLARNSLQAAFRYHRRPAETPGLALEWVRFPDSEMKAAVAQEAVVTTLVTSEGKSLTEVRLTLNNQAQPFLKVGLPQGASILTAEVAGEKVKPVQGADGDRVPMLKPGFRPSGPYPVSFVIMHSGAPFAKKGASELALPKMDVPIGVVRWEVFLPERYKVKDFGGDAVAAHLLPEGPLAPPARVLSVLPPPPPPTAPPRAAETGPMPDSGLPRGPMTGAVVDITGAAIPGAEVTVTHIATGVSRRMTTDERGLWMNPGVYVGPVRLSISSQGFQTLTVNVNHDPARPRDNRFALNVGTLTDTVTVTAQATHLNADLSATFGKTEERKQPDTAASSNVANLQRRVAGVLPIAVTVPRAGNSYRFIRPLVIDEETRLTFSYKTK